MISLRHAAGLPSTFEETVAAIEGGQKLAREWEETAAPHLIFDKTTGKKRLISHYVRRSAAGKVVGEVKQLGTITEWTAEGMAAQASGHVNLGKVRTAGSLCAAMVEVDAHLEANGWDLFGTLILATHEEDHDE